MALRWTAISSIHCCSAKPQLVLHGRIQTKHRTISQFADTTYLLQLHLALAPAEPL